VDVQGAATIRQRVAEDRELRDSLVQVFLTPESLEVLATRLKKRGTDSPEVIRKRLSNARQEIAQAKHFDYLIVSTSIAEDFRRMQAIVMAEKMRVRRQSPPEI